MEQRLLFRIWLHKYDQSSFGLTTGHTGDRGACVEPGNWLASPEALRDVNEIIDTQRDTRDDLRNNLGGEDPTNN